MLASFRFPAEAKDFPSLHSTQRPIQRVTGEFVLQEQNGQGVRLTIRLIIYGVIPPCIPSPSYFSTGTNVPSRYFGLWQELRVTIQLQLQLQHLTIHSSICFPTENRPWTSPHPSPPLPSRYTKYVPLRARERRRVIPHYILECPVRISQQNSEEVQLQTSSSTAEYKPDVLPAHPHTITKSCTFCAIQR
jgi:hypothetical protein